jgi:hypothetical protein
MNGAKWVKELVAQLTPEDRAQIKATAAAAFTKAVQNELPKDCDSWFELFASEYMSALLAVLIERSPVCACGHRQLQHEEMESQCVVPNCECMAFVVNNDPLAKAVEV